MPEPHPPYKIITYSIENLITLFSDFAHAATERIAQKGHCGYFQEYCDKLNAQTIIAEYHYTDRDFLDDYSTYYTRCFTDYDRRCIRIHLFNIVIDPEAFRDLLMGLDTPLTEEHLNQSYLGFIVVKPLPETVVGRTCLKVYPQENRRYYPCVTTIRVNLFGLNLQIASLPFQEQDQVVAACATSALWSVFQGTGKLFEHPIPTPAKITSIASAGSYALDRTFPNNGLTAEQIAQAIRTIGLEPSCIPVTEPQIFKSTLYAYLHAGIPIHLTVGLYDTIRQRLLGLHAVGVTGYSLKHGLTPYGEHDFLAEYSRIDEIYAHDDQVGPFARMKFNDKTIPIKLDDDEEERDHFTLTTSWMKGHGERGHIYAIPIRAMIPLYHKIRIPFDVIHDGIMLFDLLMKITRAPVEPLCWEMRLTTVSALKSELLASPYLDPNSKYHILTERLPRFLWRATAYENDMPVFDAFFDATDIQQAPLMRCVLEAHQGLANHLRAIAHDQFFIGDTVIPLLEQHQETQSPGFVIKMLDYFREA